MKNNHLIVISVDALVFEDLEYAKNLPAFSEILSRGSIVERVTTAYPSSTHPVHSVIMSGQPTGDTSVVNSSAFNPDNPTAPTFALNNLSDVKCDTILHAAKRAGLITACCSWPLTSGGNEVIDYLVPNAFNYDIDGFDNFMDGYRKLGATECLLGIIEEAVKLYGHVNIHPDIDYFQTHCLVEIIKRYKPNLVLTHPGEVDEVRHHYGVYADEVKSALERMDSCIGKIIQATKDAGIYEQTNFIVLGDHGQFPIMRYSSPNAIFVSEGLIKLNDKGQIASYDAYCKPAGGSAHVYLRDKSDKKTYNKVYGLLKDMAKQNVYGFDTVFTEAETKRKYGLYGDFSFVLDTDGFTSFKGSLTGPIVTVPDHGNFKKIYGTHGHSPEKGPQPTFFGAGPDIKQGVVIEKGHVLNHAPTFASILGIDLPDAKGKPVTEILK